LVNISFGELSEDQIPAATQKIKPFANPSCSHCKGEGVYRSKSWSPQVYINWSNMNGYPILRLLGLTEDELYGSEMNIAEARRALLKAINSSVDDATRTEEKLYGKLAKTNIYQKAPSLCASFVSVMH